MHSLGCLGHALALMGDHKRAIAVLGESVGPARVLGDAGQLGWHTGCLAQALLLTGRGEEASELMDRLLGPRPNSSDVAHYSRALVNWHLGRWDSVLADVRNVQALNPTTPVRPCRLGALTRRCSAGWAGRARGSGVVRAQAERIYRDRPFYCFSAWHDWASGHAEWLLGDPAAARSRFERAVKRLDSMGARSAAEQVRPDLLAGGPGARRRRASRE